ncbi:hypothetical protein ACFL2B_01130 [Patescibacteria group bacterium]
MKAAKQSCYSQVWKQWRYDRDSFIGRLAYEEVKFTESRRLFLPLTRKLEQGIRLDLVSNADKILCKMAYNDYVIYSNECLYEEIRFSHPRIKPRQLSVIQIKSNRQYLNAELNFDIVRKKLRYLASSEEDQDPKFWTSEELVIDMPWKTISKNTDERLEYTVDFKGKTLKLKVNKCREDYGKAFYQIQTRISDDSLQIHLLFNYNPDIGNNETN